MGAHWITLIKSLSLFNKSTSTRLNWLEYSGFRGFWTADRKLNALSIALSINIFRKYIMYYIEALLDLPV